jgi:hypothetical protein
MGVSSGIAEIEHYFDGKTEAVRRANVEARRRGECEFPEKISDLEIELFRARQDAMQGLA